MTIPDNAQNPWRGIVSEIEISRQSGDDRSAPFGRQRKKLVPLNRSAFGRNISKDKLQPFNIEVNGTQQTTSLTVYDEGSELPSFY